MRRSAAETKESILRAARERFALDGYDRATIRAIAGEVGIDPAMVMRYFGSKERLFAAATEYDLSLPDLVAGPADRLGFVLAAHFVDLWEGSEALQILLRSSATDAGLAERMNDIFATQLLPVVADLTPDPDEAARRAGMAAAQVFGVALCRYVLRLPPVVAMDREEIVAWIGPTLQRYLSEGAAVTTT
ncbi:TetR/AcrR family transcriptional regulator [Occultella glacieicola]|uniref:TetR/AcrR family transcriptional regulator n=1 Tax=Occultella glacieicola TaxID=2518684 RepID=A0ABY2E7W3_9MICO|nr:TetR family transcriptional regulator [Occultella glacieicola]TDE97211.1 TetR/AcrR family transcriptional regulator [Occultella glacieicola]